LQLERQECDLIFERTRVLGDWSVRKGSLYQQQNSKADSDITPARRVDADVRSEAWKGATSFRIQKCFAFQGGYVKLRYDCGYALIKAISDDAVIAQFGNGDFHFNKQDVLTKYTLFVTDLVPFYPVPVEETQQRLTVLVITQAQWQTGSHWHENFPTWNNGH
jgi:hypothetical protein